MVFPALNLNECAAMDFGREIRRRRETLGLTLEQLAEASKLTPNYIGTIENGKRDPSLSTVMALARGLRVAPAELFGGIQDLSPPATEAGLLFDGSPTDVQEAVLQILRTVSKRKRQKLAASAADTADGIRETG